MAAVHSIKKSASETTLDPIAEAGRRVTALYAAEARVDTGNPLADNAAYLTLSDMRDAVEDIVTITRATTLAGAMVQLMMAENLALQIDADGLVKADDESQRECNRRFRAITRCLYSAVAVLAQESGVDPATVGGRYWLPDHLDPWRQIDAAMGAAVE